MTTIRGLIEDLETMADLHPDGDDARVLIAIQPNWPLALELNGVVTFSQESENGETVNIVWLTADGHPHDLNPYAPRKAWDVGLEESVAMLDADEEDGEE